MGDNGISGLRVIVTGGASGMGEAVVKDLVRHGARVASLDMNDEAGAAIVAAAGAKAQDGGSAVYVHCDVADEASVRDAFAAAAEALGGLEVLVHCAGVAPGAPAAEITLSGWEKVFAINARGTFLTNQAAFELMKAGGYGRIINFASAAGIIGLPNKAHYAATKGAVLAWSRTVAKEWGRHGVTVNCIAPAIETPMYRKTRSLMAPEALEALDARLASDMPIDGKLGDPDRDLAPVIRFIAGPGSRFMTGQVFAVDGGTVMVR
jgi:NAD(P)-dependent dehydrogenase (short-subunit alcohol dehydrogenase family)